MTNLSIDPGTILLVEDEITQRRMISLQLARKGFTVIEAEDGIMGLEYWRNQPGIRIVITDLLMPRRDGFSLIESIRAEERHYTYIIVLTGLADRASLVRAFKLGADDYLVKPVFPEELSLRLRGAGRLLRLEGLDALVFGLAEMAASRSGETGSHLLRVRNYCRILAEHLLKTRPELELTPVMAADIASVSVLHDIGKVGIPDAILHKPGRLSAKEYDVMKRHTTIGGDLLQNLLQQNGSLFLQLARDIALCHHEKWDGSGYPKGRLGEEIPVAARIMALADVFDALTSERSYKEAFSFQRARDIIVAGEGKQFDPGMVQAFLATEDSWRQSLAESSLKKTPG